MKRPYQPAKVLSESGTGANPQGRFRGVDSPCAVWYVEATLDTSEANDTWLFLWDGRPDAPSASLGEPIARIPVPHTGGQTLRAWAEREPLICTEGLRAEWSSDPVTFTAATRSGAISAQWKPLAAWLAERACGCAK